MDPGKVFAEDRLKGEPTDLQVSQFAAEKGAIVRTETHRQSRGRSHDGSRIKVRPQQPRTAKIACIPNESQSVCGANR
jgi:hypothetical protein